MAIQLFVRKMDRITYLLKIGLLIQSGTYKIRLNFKIPKVKVVMN